MPDANPSSAAAFPTGADSRALDPLVRSTVEAAVASAWSFFSRSAGQGLDWEDIHGCHTQADYRARLAAEPGLLLQTCQALLEYDTGLTEAERADCRRVVAIADALALRFPAAAPAKQATPAAPEAAPVDPVPPAAAGASAAAAAAPAPVTPRSRAGQWISAGAVLAAVAAALVWLGGKQPRPRPVLPGTAKSAATGQAGLAVPAPVPSDSPNGAAPTTEARPSGRPTAQAVASARPGLTVAQTGAAPSPRPAAASGGPVPPAAVPAVPKAAPAATPVPAAPPVATPAPLAPQSAPTAG